MRNFHGSMNIYQVGSVTITHNDDWTHIDIYVAGQGFPFRIAIFPADGSIAVTETRAVKVEQADA